MSADETKELKVKSAWPWFQVIGMGFVGIGGILSILGMVGNYVPVVCGAIPNKDAGAFTPDQIPSFVLMMTFYGFGMLWVQFFAGHLWLKVKTPILMFVCYTVPMICVALMGSFTELWQFWAAFFVIGTFGGCIYMIAGGNIMFNWFVKHVAVAGSIAGVLSGIGQAVLSPIHQFFISEFGWRMAYPLGAALGCVLALPWIIFVIRFRPEDKGVRPYGWEPGMQNITAGDEDAPGVGLKSGVFSLAFIALFLGIAVSSMFGGYQNLWGDFAREYAPTLVPDAALGGELVPGWGESITSSQVASYMISATGLFNCILPLLGLIIDKFGAAYTSFVILASQIIAALGMMYLHSSWVALVIFTFFFADVNGIMLGTLGIIMRSMFGPRNFTKINSYMQLGLGAVGSFGAPIVGLVAATFGTYNAAMWMAIILVVVIALFMFIGFQAAKKLTWEDGSHPNPWKPYRPGLPADVAEK